MADGRRILHKTKVNAILCDSSDFKDEFALGEGICEVVLFLLFVEEEGRAEELVVHQLYYDNFI